MPRIIAGDAGRSSIKVAYFDEATKKIKTHLTEARHAKVDMAYLKNQPILDWNPDTQILVSVDGSDIWAYSKGTDKFAPPESVMHVTEDKMYLEYANTYLLATVAQVVKDKEEVMLSINMTYSNHQHKDAVKGKLGGAHNVKFYSPNGKVVKEINFTVTKITTLFQGWSSLLYMLIGEDMKENNFYTGQIILMDMGSKTLDCVLCQELTAVKGISYDLGTTYMFELIKNNLSAKHQIKKQTYEIEQMIMKGMVLYAKDGTEIDMKGYLKDAIYTMAERIVNTVNEDFGSYYPQGVVLTGGGIRYFKDILERELYPNHKPKFEVPADPQFSNAVGMARFVVFNREQK